MLNLYSLLAAFDNLDPMNWQVIKASLNILWQGLLAIFVVIGLIIITVKLTSLTLNKITQIQKEREAAKKTEDNENQS